MLFNIEDIKDNDILLLCDTKMLEPKSEKSKCDFCGVMVFLKTVLKYDNKICPECLKKVPKEKIIEYRLTPEAEEKHKDLRVPKMTAS